jgi:ribonucleoside-diphosphate reductase alpha chain
VLTAWDAALALGARYGYRNAQVSAIAPTGTIGLVMDCDTTGIEPEFALVKFKKLAGGGYFKIINRAVPEALARLGYDTAASQAIVEYAIGKGTLENAPGVDHAGLGAKGFTKEKLAAVEAALAGAFDLRFAFNKWTLGEAFCTDVLGLDPAELAAPNFDMLAALGFSKDEIEAANLHCCGAMTLEGAPGLKPEHLAVFDCANLCGRFGTRSLSIESHIRMMAVAQPFISGGISKTINMPNEATVEDCKAAFMLSWRLGLKANALYRDGSKLSQPLNAHITEDEGAEALIEEPVRATPDRANLRLVEAPEDRLSRRRAPAAGRRKRQRAVIGGHKLGLGTASFRDGRLAEVMIDAEKANPVVRALLNNLGLAISAGLQHGVPLDEYVQGFERWRVESPGACEGSAILDHIFRELAVAYVSDREASAAQGQQRAAG